MNQINISLKCSIDCQIINDYVRPYNLEMVIFFLAIILLWKDKVTMAVNVKYKVYGSLEQFLRRKKKSRKRIKISALFGLNAFIETPLEKKRW